MATISIIKLIFVLPVPVTPLSQILATLININPTIHSSTGIPLLQMHRPCQTNQKIFREKYLPADT